MTPHTKDGLKLGFAVLLVVGVVVAIARSDPKMNPSATASTSRPVDPHAVAVYQFSRDYFERRFIPLHPLTTRDEFTLMLFGLGFSPERLQVLQTAPIAEAYRTVFVRAVGYQDVADRRRVLLELFDLTDANAALVSDLLGVAR